MIAIVDYGMGNIVSLKSILVQCGAESVLTRDHRVLEDADRIILPGVGAFPAAIDNLHSYDLFHKLVALADSGKPFLGICLGMQLLGKFSEEISKSEGLGLIDGEVKYFTHTNTNEMQKIPHVGFNSVHVMKSCPLFEGIESGSDFYFTHSFRMQCADAETISGTTSNGELFVSSVSYKNVFGTQFHPELSQSNGIKLITNFINNV